MPTIISHAAVPIALSLGLGQKLIPRRLLVTGILLSALPDVDVIGFRFGVDYASPFGHRGFTHSIFMALAVSLFVTFMSSEFRASARRSFVFLFAAMVSHGLLDTLTNGGLGVALLWPFSESRYFAPLTPIEVSPIGLANFLSRRGLVVLISELRWLWLPLLSAGLLAAVWRWRPRPARQAGSGSAHGDFDNQELTGADRAQAEGVETGEGDTVPR